MIQRRIPDGEDEQEQIMVGPSEKTQRQPKTTRIGSVTPSVGLTLALLLSGCSFDHFQKPPTMSAPGHLGEIPTTKDDTPALAAANAAGNKETPQASPGSLWRPGAKNFFRDSRAATIGDLLTVEIDLQNLAEFGNNTDLSRENNSRMSLGGVLGLNNTIANLLQGGNARQAIDIGGESTTNGQARIRRNERVRINVAATVTRVLPNGNLEIAGSQEVRLNDELREVQLRGIVRPEDIRSSNRIASDKIAEARISYGGRGVATDTNRQRWGQQGFDLIRPF